VATAIALDQDSYVPLGIGNSAASPPFTQYAAVWPTLAVESTKDPTVYTSLPEIAIPTAQEVAGEFVMSLGIGNVVGVPFSQYAAVPLPTLVDPLPATYTSPPETAMPTAPYSPYKMPAGMGNVVAAPLFTQDIAVSVFALESVFPDT
jgi:hypothetical protein